jgi:hypothetical protein
MSRSFYVKNYKLLGIQEIKLRYFREFQTLQEIIGEKSKITN